MDTIISIMEYLTKIADQVRSLRIDQELDQAGLAALANVSVGAIKNLESGKGSSLTTLIAVVTALGRADWLESLNPQSDFDPLAMLKAKLKEKPRQRVHKPRQP